MTSQVIQEPSRASSATSVASANTDTVLLVANDARSTFAVENDSTAILYLLLSNAVSSSSNYTVKMAPGSYYECPGRYTGPVKGIWASANGNARVTEFI